MNGRYTARKNHLRGVIIGITAVVAASCSVDSQMYYGGFFAMAPKSTKNTQPPSKAESLLFVYINDYPWRTDFSISVNELVVLTDAKRHEILRLHVEPGDLRVSFRFRNTSWIGSAWESDTVNFRSIGGAKYHYTISVRFDRLGVEESRRLEQLDWPTRVFHLCANNTRLCAEGEKAGAPPAPAKP